MQLLHNRVSFHYPFRLGPFALTTRSEFKPCNRGEQPALRLYLTPSVHQQLHLRRFTLTDRALSSTSGLLFDQIEVAQIDDRLGLLVLCGRLEPIEDTPPAAPRRAATRRRTAERTKGPPPRPRLGPWLSTVDTARLRGELFPDQERPGWTLGTRRFTGLEDVLNTLLPGSEPIFADLRLPCFLHAAFARTPSLATRYAVAAVDPPELPPPPADLLRSFARTQSYRRWEKAGMYYAFTHYSGAVLSTGAPLAWLDPLLRSQYLDLASWVMVTAAQRHLLAQEARAGRLSRAARAAHLRTYEAERFSEQDQGRALVRLWLSVIEQDYRDLEQVGSSNHGQGSTEPGV